MTAQGPADELLRRLLDAHRRLQPARRDVLPERGELGLQRLVGAPVGRAEEAQKLPAHRVLIGAEQQVAAIRGRQEIVRVAAQQRQLDPEDLQQLGRHHPAQIRPCRYGESGRPREGSFRARRSADDHLLLEHAHAQPATRQQHRGDEPVVARADDNHVRVLRHHRHA
jgi:hypothetical protein